MKYYMNFIIEIDNILEMSPFSLYKIFEIAYIINFMFMKTNYWFHPQILNNSFQVIQLLHTFASMLRFVHMIPDMFRLS